MKKPTAERQANDLPQGLAQPALRALASAGIKRLDQLTRFDEAAIKQLHGIGPNALDVLRRALRTQGMAFADGKKRKLKGVVRKGKTTNVKDSHDRFA